MSRRHPKKNQLRKRIFQWINCGASLFIMILPLFFVLKNYEFPKSQLIDIDVTVASKLEHKNKGKSKHFCYVIKTIEFKKEFKIYSLVYQATNSDLLKDIRPYDRITLKVLKEDLKDLKETSLFGNYNKVYGVIKDNKSYINLDLWSHLKSRDMRFLLIITLIGLIMFVYCFIRKPIIKIKITIYVLSSIFFIYLLISK